MGYPAKQMRNRKFSNLSAGVDPPRHRIGSKKCGFDTHYLSKKIWKNQALNGSLSNVVNNNTIFVNWKTLYSGSSQITCVSFLPE